MPSAQSLLGVLSVGVTAAGLGRRAHPRRCRNRLGLRIASPRGSTGDVVVSEHDVVETASPAKRRVGHGDARISWRPPAARTKTPLVG
jgi:hypothetical protein